MRELFPIFDHLPDLIYLDSAATSHKPRCVIDAMTKFYSEENATVHRAIYHSSLAATEKYNQARETIKSFLNASSSEEIVFTRGTTDAINLVAQSFGARFQEGDEIVISEMEHHSNLVPWQMLAQKVGAKLSYISVDSEGVLDWRSKITSKTKLVALAHVSNVTGTVNPIQEIAAFAHQKGAVLLVDGAQGAPHMPVDVQALDCDFYAFSGHKCYGPTGVGVLYGKKELLESMPPVQGGGDMIESVELEKTTYRASPMRFEAGTPIIAPVIGLKSALEFLMDFGLERAALHGKVLLEAAIERLKTIPHLQILGSAPQRGPLLTFHVDGIHPLDLATFLDLKKIAIRSGHLCAQPALKAFGLQTAARASFAIYNTLEEVEIFADALQEVVSTTLASR